MNIYHYLPHIARRIPLVYIRFLIGGGTAAFVDLASLFLLQEVFLVPYWYSVNIAFALATISNFFLQKLWTFEDKTVAGAHWQVIKFFIGGVFNLIANSAIMYLLTVVFDVWYLLAQVFSLGILAVFNFFLYKYVIFTKPKERNGLE